MYKLTLAQVIDMAQTTELAGLGLKNDYRTMVNLLNMTLIDLHARLVINQGIVSIPIEHNKEIYNIEDYVENENKG